jgi:hypothetical protein
MPVLGLIARTSFAGVEAHVDFEALAARDPDGSPVVPGYKALGIIGR